MELLETDSSEGDIKLALNEVEKMKRIIKNKYQKVLMEKEYIRMWNKTLLLEKQLKERLLLIELFMAPESRKGKGR